MHATQQQTIDALAEHLRPILEHSPDGVYVWLDETSKRCNERLARMFGCTIEEWEAVTDFARTFVDDADRGLYVWNYQNRVRDLRYPVTFRFRGKRLDGTTFDAETDMIPLTYDGQTVAYHFVREIRP